MKLLLIGLLALACSTCYSQTTERRFFSEWGIPTSKDSSTYFRTWSFEKQDYNAFTYYTSSNQVKAYEPRSGGSLHGEATYFHENGQVHFKTKYEKGTPYGVVETYYPNGKLQKIQSYDSVNTRKLIAPLLLQYYDSAGNQLVKNGSGEVIEYSIGKQGLQLNHGWVKNGLKDSVWLTHYPNGKLFYREEWIQGKFLIGKSYNEKGEPSEYKELDTQAGPKGGMAAFYKHVNEKMNYPKEAKRLGIEGRVFVEFVVERDGTLSNIRVVRGLSTDCDHEAVRVVGTSPKWKPGLQKGQPVRSKFNLAIIFKLS